MQVHKLNFEKRNDQTDHLSRRKPRPSSGDECAGMEIGGDEADKHLQPESQGGRGDIARVGGQLRTYV